MCAVIFDVSSDLALDCRSSYLWRFSMFCSKASSLSSSALICLSISCLCFRSIELIVWLRRYSNASAACINVVFILLLRSIESCKRSLARRSYSSACFYSLSWYTWNFYSMNWLRCEINLLSLALTLAIAVSFFWRACSYRMRYIAMTFWPFSSIILSKFRVFCAFLAVSAWAFDNFLYQCSSSRYYFEYIVSSRLESI